jgi:hypothetical protein
MFEVISQIPWFFFRFLSLLKAKYKYLLKSYKLFGKLHYLPVGLIANITLGVSVVIAAPYVISENGQEVIDSQTGLVWRRCAEGMAWIGSGCTGSSNTYTHEQALQRAASEASSSGFAWRLPNVKELASIIDRTQFKPAIDASVFPGAPADWFWSSSPFVSYPAAALMVNFYDGTVNSHVREATLAVRLVR